MKIHLMNYLRSSEIGLIKLI